MNIKVISFDMDGCLSEVSFENKFYYVELPKLIAKKEGLSFEKAYEYVTKEYDNFYGKKEWADPLFWLKYFEIKVPLQEIIKEIKKDIKHYKDTVPVLSSLKKDYRLVVVSASTRPFLELKLEEENLRSYFEAVFSTTEDFDTMKKEPEIYKTICIRLGISADEMCHIGDSFLHDYENPTKAGIKSFLIDRSLKKEQRKPYVVHDLYEFEKEVRALG